MKLLASFAALVSLGTALALECESRKDFSAATLDALNFVPGVSYYDFVNGIYLFENQQDASSTVFVRAPGTSYVRNRDGTCAKFNSQLGEVGIY